MNRRELIVSSAKAAVAAAVSGRELASGAQAALATAAGGAALAAGTPSLVSPAEAQPTKRPNIVILMTDDTGWNDFGCYSGGGAGLGHPTPNVDRMAKEGAVFTCWYGQASCTAGRASFITGRWITGVTLMRMAGD